LDSEEVVQVGLILPLAPVVGLDIVLCYFFQLLSFLVDMVNG
jgi:hypothetical protein